MFFYSKNILINNVKSNNDGTYKIKIKRKYFKNNCFIIIQPISKNIYLDTIIKKNKVTAIEISGIIPDTIVIINNQNFEYNFDLKYKYEMVNIEDDK